MSRSVYSVRGFSLIELIFVLILIGILTAAGYGMVKNARTLSAERDTDKALTEHILEIRNAAASAGRMPETTPAALQDGYGRELRLELAPTRDICIREPEGISLIVCRDESCEESDELKDVAAVVYGSGGDGVFQTVLSGNALRIPHAGSDDSLRWLTYGELALDAACGSFRIVTNNVPPVYSESRYEAEFHSVPAAERWCIETDGDTAGLLNISGSCEIEADFSEGSSMRFVTETAVFNESGVKLLKVYAVRGGAVVSEKFAVPFYPEDMHAPATPIMLISTDELLLRNAAGGGSAGVDVYMAPEEILTSFTIKESAGDGSACLWVDRVFGMQKVFRMYYEVETGYTDNHPNSIGSAFGGYGLAVYPAADDGSLPLCGMHGSAGLGYGGLSFGGLGLVMEVDLFPDRRFDYTDYPSKNHIAFIPCNASGNSCLGNHYDSAVPACPADEGCFEPETESVNWLEDGKSRPVRVELHAGYADGTCSAKRSGGGYILAKAWTNCTSCSDVSVDYGRRKADITHCVNAGEDREMLNFGLGFTFGGEAGTDISFKSFLFSVE